MSSLKEISSSRCFGGYQKVFSHDSIELKCPMKFSVYLPPAAEEQKVPLIYWLSGLTCTERNFIEKGGAQQYASKYGIMIVGPDTSPREVNIPGEDDSFDFGSGAGFYVDATQDPWKKNYRMYSYVTKELPQLIAENFPVIPNMQSIMGHSMGGHGALICALKNPGKYQSVSAFAPISNPMKGNWGRKAFTGYLGPDTSTWSDWDTVELIGKYNGPPIELLVEQGKDDEYLDKKELLTENLLTACQKKAGEVRLVLNMREKYDHSYFFVSTFIADHIAYHAKFLKH
ncbi:hypothetical protein RUM43_000820 [Polyplax serrata]|uniref:S-formylglutathione hydrolase n=1 Tax=Polyplax serrata TaxID=468196 RepID=A0AAN8SCY2_POLSC